MAASGRGRICSQTFVIEGIPDEQVGYDGSPLLRVKGEKVDQFYMNREAQKEHWPLFRVGYKKSQAKLKDGRSYLEAYEKTLTTLEICENELEQHIKRSPEGSAEFPIVLKKLRVLMDEEPDEAEDQALTLHGLIRGVTFHPPNLMAKVMATPGMTSLLLGDMEEDLLSEQARVIKKLSKYNGPPTEEYIRDFIPDPAEKKRVRVLKKKIERLELVHYNSPSSCSYCYIYFNLLLASVVKSEASSTSGPDGLGYIRGSDGPETNHIYRLAIAALRRALSLFTDPFVLLSCNDAMNPGASLMLTALRHYEERGILGGRECRKDEIVPGMTLDGCVQTCIRELEMQSNSVMFDIDVLEHIAIRPKLWDQMNTSIERRASVLLSLLTYMNEYKTVKAENDELHFPKEYNPPLKECNAIIKAVCGLFPQKNLEMTKEVFKKAATEGEFLGPRVAGKNAQSRGFMYFLDRLEHYDVVDFAKEIEAFQEIEKEGKGVGSESMRKLKEECMREVYGERRFKELEEERTTKGKNKKNKRTKNK